MMQGYTLIVLQPTSPSRRHIDGIAVYIRDDVVPLCKVHKPTWDVEARVVVIIVQTKQAIIGVDSVCCSRTGTDKDDKRNTARTLFDANMIKLIQDMKQQFQLQHILVIGDLNVHADINNLDGLSALFSKQHAINSRVFRQHFLGETLQLYDLWREMHPTKKQYTYQRNSIEEKSGKPICTRLDYALVSSSLVNDALTTMLPLDQDWCKASHTSNSSGSSNDSGGYHSPIWTTLRKLAAQQCQQ
jgi:exonuclease III